MKVRGAGTGGAIAPPIFLKTGKIVEFSTPNISRSKEGGTPKKSTVQCLKVSYNFKSLV